MTVEIKRGAFALLALTIRKHPTTYNQGYWGRVNDNESAVKMTLRAEDKELCGMVACLAGHAAMNAGWVMVRDHFGGDRIMSRAVPRGTKVLYNESGYLDTNGVETRYISDVGREQLFGITDEDRIGEWDGDRYIGTELEQSLVTAASNLFGGSWGRRLYSTDGADGVARALEEIALSYDDEHAVRLINDYA